MRSTFGGLETAKRGMVTQQIALSTTGHNIANANTPGYSRQTVNFQTTTPWPGSGLNRPMLPGQIGTGVEASSINRVRESFLDVQYRGENPKSAFWKTQSQDLSRVEDIFNEPSDEGINKSIDRFWQSLQDLSTNPSDLAAREVVLSRGQSIGDTMNFMSNSLNKGRLDSHQEVSNTEGKINIALNNINDLNKKISELESIGLVPNDLYDQRDTLIDELSGYVNLEVDPAYVNNGKEGPKSVYLVDDKGNRISPAMVDATSYTVNELKVNHVADSAIAYGYFSSISVGTTDVKIEDLGKKGQFIGTIHSYGFEKNDATKTGVYYNKLSQLNKMVKSFADAFNGVHNLGAGLDGSTNLDFFNYGGNEFEAAKAMGVQITDSQKLAAASSSTSGAGDGSHAKKLSDALKGMGVTYNFKNEYESLISKLGVEAQEANRMTSNTSVITNSISQNRLSVSSVSLDEEMINLVKYQQAYNASARNITIIDEMLDKVINGLGTGGR